MAKRKPLAKKEEDVRVIFPNAFVYREFLAFERRSLPEFKRQFSRRERIIWFCRTALGWSKDKIRDKAGISERQTRKFLSFIKIGGTI